MKYWDSILAEVLNRDDESTKFVYTNLGKRKKKHKCVHEATSSGGQKKQEPKAYPLGEKYGKNYFTRREAQCMMQLLHGKTFKLTAEALNLSPRTVEYYVKNMKDKLGCRTKPQLIERVIASDFLQHVDF